MLRCSEAAHDYLDDSVDATYAYTGSDDDAHTAFLSKCTGR